MPVVSDFTTILGDKDVTIGDGSNEAGWTVPFGVGAPEPGETGYISLMVRGMTAATTNAQVFLNDNPIGQIFNNNGGNKSHWTTQMVSFGSHVKNGTNILRVMPVANPNPGADQYDDFTIRNVICHFHQFA